MLFLKYTTDQVFVTPIYTVPQWCFFILGLKGAAVSKSKKHQKHHLSKETSHQITFKQNETKHYSFQNSDRKICQKVKNLVDFDDYFTAPIHGFRDADDYFSKQQFEITAPMLLSLLC